MRVLVVEDNALLRHHLKVQLQELGHQVDAAEDAREADYYLGEHLPDIAIVDLGLPDGRGVGNVEVLRAIDRKAAIIVLTGRLVKIEVPRSPWMMCQAHSPKRTRKGRSRPRLARMRSTSAGVAWSPAITAAGSPGAR